MSGWSTTPALCIASLSSSDPTNSARAIQIVDLEEHHHLGRVVRVAEHLAAGGPVLLAERGVIVEDRPPFRVVIDAVADEKVGHANSLSLARPPACADPTRRWPRAPGRRAARKPNDVTIPRRARPRARRARACATGRQRRSRCPPTSTRSRTGATPRAARSARSGRRTRSAGRCRPRPRARVLGADDPEGHDRPAARHVTQRGEVP